MTTRRRHLSATLVIAAEAATYLALRSDRSFVEVFAIALAAGLCAAGAAVWCTRKRAWWRA